MPGMVAQGGDRGISSSLARLSSLMRDLLSRKGWRSWGKHLRLSSDPHMHVCSHSHTHTDTRRHPPIPEHTHTYTCKTTEILEKCNESNVRIVYCKRRYRSLKLIKLCDVLVEMAFFQTDLQV